MIIIVCLDVTAAILQQIKEPIIDLNVTLGIIAKLKFALFVFINDTATSGI